MKKYFFIALLLYMVKLNAQMDTVSLPGIGYQQQFITDLLIDNTDNYWLTSKQQGVRRYDGTQWVLMPIASHVYTAKQAANGDFWFGSDIGLIQYDMIDTTVYNTSNSGIPSNVVFALYFDNNDLWLGTTNGLSKYDGNTWINYNSGNSSLNCDTINGIELNNGVFYLSTSRGISTFAGGVFTNDSSPAFTYANNQPTSIKISGMGKWMPYSNTLYDFSDSTFLKIDAALNICPIKTTSYNYGRRSVENTQNNGLACLGDDGIYEFENNTYRFFYGINAVGSILKRKGNSYYFFSRPNFNGSRVLRKLDVSTSTLSFQPLDLYCMTAGSQASLNINQVSANMLDRGDMFWDLNSNPGYEVPKGSGSYAGFAGSIWIGGKVNDQLRTACQTYRQNGVDFWPGPLDTVTAANPDSGTGMGNIMKVNRYDVENFIYNFNNGNVQNGTFSPVYGITNWPAHGTGNLSRNTAPFIDVNNNGVYDPMTGGDYPDIKGDQMLYHIYNDASGMHTETHSPGAMGIEVRQKSYAYVCDGINDSMKVLNYTTFYEFEIINRSDTLIDSMYIGYWNDSDLGFYNDDYIGCNVKENYGYIYNGDNYDQDGSGVVGYHDNLPCFSTAILESPFAITNDGKDNDRDGIIDEQDEQVGMSSFNYINNTSNAINGNPNYSPEYYNYISGKWRGGSIMTYGGNGVGGTQATKYLYPGSSDPLGYSVGGGPGNPMPQPAWSEVTAGNTPGDRRFTVGSGPFQLAAKDTTKIVYAMVFTQSGVNPFAAVAQSEVDVKRIKAWYNNNNFPSCLDLSTLSVKETKKVDQNYSFYPNPASSMITIVSEQLIGQRQVEVYDMLGNLVLDQQIMSNKQQINIESLANGVYIVKINDPTSPVSFKLIKQ